jgi:hypothetical protein
MRMLASRLLSRHVKVIAAGAVATTMLGIGAAVWAVANSPHHRAVDVLRTVGAPPADELPTIVPTPTPTPTPTVSAVRSLVPTPSVTLPAEPSAVSSARAGDGGGGVPGNIGGSIDPYCRPGPLPPDMHADATCDIGKHSGIPRDNCQPFNACGWWDAWGAVADGPNNGSARASDEGDIDVTWITPNSDLKGDYYAGPIKEFVIRLYQSGSTQMLREYERGTSMRSMTVTGVAPGDYDVTVMELNDSGLSAGVDIRVTVPPKPTPSPGPPTASPTPSPTAPDTSH